MVQELFNLLLGEGITPNQYSILYHCRENLRCPLPNSDGEARILQLKGYLDTDNKLTAKADSVLKKADLIFGKSTIVPAGNLAEQIKEYRSKFPTGRKGSFDEVEKKLLRLFKNHPELNMDIIQKATTLYLSTMARNGEERYIMKAGNFIEHVTNKTNTILEWCEQVLEGEAPKDDNPMYEVA